MSQGPEGEWETPPWYSEECFSTSRDILSFIDMVSDNHFFGVTISYTEINLQVGNHGYCNV